VGPRGRKPCSSRLSRGSGPDQQPPRDAEVVAGDVDQISFANIFVSAQPGLPHRLPTDSRTQTVRLPLNEVSIPDLILVYVIDTGRVCALAKGRPDPDEIRSRYTNEQWAIAEIGVRPLRGERGGG
jgi:hypothetical protein